MVQLLEELPPELQAHIAGSLDNAAAAGRWAQASGASRLLLLRRLNELLEVRRSARQQAALEKLQRMRCGSAAALSVYNLVNGDAAIHVQAHKLDSYVCVCCPVLVIACCRLALAAQTSCGTSRPSSTGPAIASKFTAWPLMRMHGAHLRRERPNLPSCSREQQPCSGHSSSVWLYNLL